MAHPVTGPFLTVTGDRNTKMTVLYGFRQKKPYNLMLTPHINRKINMVSTQGNRLIWISAQGVDDYLSLETDADQPAEDNAAYSKFLGKMRAQNASLGVTLAEQSSARKMMIDRSRQSLDFAQALLRRDFQKAYRVAMKDFPAQGPGVSRFQPKSFSGLYLEWSWGWSPMISDIGESLKTLVDPITPIYARAVHRNFYQRTARHYSNFAGYTPSTEFPYGFYWRQVSSDFWDVQRESATGATISVDNPNVALANRLGLLNLPQIVWQVQPFSFIVDKYLNVGQMLGSLSDTYGFTLTNAWKSRRCDLQFDGAYEEKRAYDKDRPTVVLHDFFKITGFAKSKRRLSGLLGPSFTFRRPSIGSFGEAVSYMALLNQLLSSKS